MKEIYNNDDLEKYRQVNGSLNDEGNKIFSERMNTYMEEKMNKVKNMKTRELIEYMYKNGELPEAEYEKYIDMLNKE